MRSTKHAHLHYILIAVIIAQENNFQAFGVPIVAEFFAQYQFCCVACKSYHQSK